MAVSAAAVAKAAAMLLTNEKTRKGLGWILVAIFSPVILLIALLCSLGSGGAEHNNYSVEACFYGAEFSAEVPAEFRYHIEEMRSAFSLLDSAVSSANGQMDSGNSLDPIRVKAVFYALCFGDDAPSTRAANSFVECFYTTETRTRTVEVTLEDGTTSTEEEEYTVAVPVSLSQAYANLEAHLGREITDDDKSNIDHIYTMIAGSAGGGSYSGEYLRGDGSSIELDISAFTDPTTKNAADLVTYAIHAWESGWGYVWGTYGSVLTDSLFAYKLEQYLNTKNAGGFLPEALSAMLTGTLDNFAGRMGSLLFKQGVDLNVLGQIIAYDTDIDECEYQRLRGRAIRDMKRTNGRISFKDALDFQKSV